MPVAEDYKSQIVLSALLAPVLGGALIYYALRKQSLAMANFGNRWSFVAFGLWIATYFALQSIDIAIPQIVLELSTLAGLILGVLTVSNIKKAAPARRDQPGA